MRLAGCDLRCSWCDTEYAFHEGRAMSVEQVLEEVRSYDCRLVEVTGGEPLLQDEVHELMVKLLEAGHEVLLETSGSRSTARVPSAVGVILDVKPPGSGMEEHNLPENLERLGPGDEVKFVISDRADYEWSKDLAARHQLASRVPVLLSPAHDLLDPAELAAWILEDRLEVRLQIQVHKHIWPPDTRGV